MQKYTQNQYIYIYVYILTDFKKVLFYEQLL